MASLGREHAYDEDDVDYGSSCHDEEVVLLMVVMKLSLKKSNLLDGWNKLKVTLSVVVVVVALLLLSLFRL